MKKYLILGIVIFILGFGAVAATDRIVTAQFLKNNSALVTVPSATSVLATRALSETFTNKTIDADLNTLQDIDNNEIKASAGIIYSKLNLTGSLVDADIAALAAVSRSKLASGTSNHVLVNDGSGVMSSEAQLAVSRGGTGSASLTANNVILGNGTSAVLFVAPGTSGNVLTSNGTTWASTAPAASAYTFIGSAYYANTSGCIVTRTTAGNGPFDNTAAACPGPTVEASGSLGTIQTTDVDTPTQITVNGLCGGAACVVRIIMTSYGYPDASNNPSFKINDGSTTAGARCFAASMAGEALGMTCVAYFDYNADPGNKTFYLYGDGNGSPTLTVDNDNGDNQTQWSIEKVAN